MKIDITSMFFNSKIEGATATPAWGTSVAKQTPPCTIYETPDVINIISGMLFSSKTDFSNLKIEGMSSGRELVLFSVFDDIYVNGLKLEDASFILLLVREHSQSHEGRILLSYPMYAKYKTEDGIVISNEDTKNKIANSIGCSENGCWFVSDISIANQNTLLINAHVVDSNNPKIYRGTSKERSNEWKGIVDNSTSIKNDVMLKTLGNTLPILVDAPNDDFSQDELGSILDSWYKNGGPDAIRAFGLRYGELITTKGYGNKEIIKTSPSLKDTAYDAELGKGISLYKSIKEKKYGLSFVDDVLLATITKSNQDMEQPLKINDPLQQISYGAPGTGKSRGIKDKESLFDEVIRTTFHPDTDYSTFVGAYKPVVESVDVKVVPVVLNDGASFDKNNGTYKEKKITYKFVKQSFLKAYIAAWKGLKQGKKVLLDIEEINRGNCAQIFGDIFQLLDREVEGDMTGYSTYPIDADEDISKLLKEEFEDSDIDLAYIKDGSKLLLPPNLYIWATMNTSDQSLFPIDSAFKRRWDWEYVPINYSNTDWKIVLDDKEYSWVKFQQEINKRIKDATDGSEDKQMGDFFVNVKHKGGIIDSNLLLNKIVFYLWNDVCKDGEGDIFKILNDDKKAEEITFSEFFKGDSIKKLQQWMDFLGVKSGAGEQNDDTAQDKEDFESKKEEEE